MNCACNHCCTCICTMIKLRQWLRPIRFYRLEFLLDAISVELPLNHLLCLFGSSSAINQCALAHAHAIHIGRLCCYSTELSSLCEAFASQTQYGLSCVGEANA